MTVSNSEFKTLSYEELNSINSEKSLYFGLLLNSIKKLELNFRITHLSNNIELLFTEYNNTKYLLNFNIVESFSKISIDSNLILLIEKKFPSFSNENGEIIFIFLTKSVPSRNNTIKSKKLEIRDVLRYLDLNSVKNCEKQYTFDSNGNQTVGYLVKRTQLKKGFPISRVKDNPINELSSREWIKFTKTWFILNPKRRNRQEISHPAKYPEEIVERYIKFFTKKGDIVFDPFLGVGSTLVAAKRLSRNGIGIELSEKYYNIAKKRCNEVKINKNHAIDSYFSSNSSNQQEKCNTHLKRLYSNIINGDSRNILQIWKEREFPPVDFCITSPPYWNQLKRNSLRQAERKKSGLDVIYSNDENDIGNIDDYYKFLKSQQDIFKVVYEILKEEKYLVVITNNVYADKRMYPLAFDTVNSLYEIGWIPLDEQIWLQNDKALRPLGIFKKYMGNRSHQYCLIFQKINN